MESSLNTPKNGVNGNAFTTIVETIAIDYPLGHEKLGEIPADRFKAARPGLSFVGDNVKTYYEKRTEDTYSASVQLSVPYSCEDQCFVQVLSTPGADEDGLSYATRLEERIASELTARHGKSLGLGKRITPLDFTIRSLTKLHSRTVQVAVSHD